MNIFSKGFFVLAEAAGVTSAGAEAMPADGGLMGIMTTMVIPFGLMIVVFYFLLIRPEKKRAKRMKEMLSNIQVADEVVTTGGIIGRVISVKEDTVLIETGSDRTKIRVLRSSISENRTVHDS
ncbi:MAG: preprotein translocase subunit YajC [Eubacterium sp.]|jgi:preprotein translocase subunit YajC|nr:preprotein translocase subunit YajC [Eubacterium sp.]